MSRSGGGVGRSPMLLLLSKGCHLLVALGAEVRTEPLQALANVPWVSSSGLLKSSLY